jgi:hypothetical protein
MAIDIDKSPSLRDLAKLISLTRRHTAMIVPLFFS